jgi:predicted Zn-ribbon and HTH transcriptional regulator
MSPQRYTCGNCGATMDLPLERCPKCGVLLSGVKCEVCNYLGTKTEFINNGNRCPKCNSAVQGGLSLEIAKKLTSLASPDTFYFSSPERLKWPKRCAICDGSDTSSSFIIPVKDSPKVQKIKITAPVCAKDKKRISTRVNIHRILVWIVILGGIGIGISSFWWFEGNIDTHILGLVCITPIAFVILNFLILRFYNVFSEISNSDLERFSIAYDRSSSMYRFHMNSIGERHRSYFQEIADLNKDKINRITKPSFY